MMPLEVERKHSSIALPNEMNPIESQLYTAKEKTKEYEIQENQLGDEAPSGNDFLKVLIAIAVLIALAWVAYYKFHWEGR